MLRMSLMRLLGALAVAAVLFIPVAALAHETQPVGDYEVEYGWLSEPAVVGQPNAVVINISKSDEPIDIDPVSLTVEAVYGPETKTLELQPLGEDTTGEYIARLTPTRTGVYTIHLTGSIEEQSVDIQVQPEEIENADVVEFPSAPQAAAGGSSFGLTGWLAVVALVFGLAGTGFGLAAYMRK